MRRAAITVLVCLAAVVPAGAQFSFELRSDVVVASSFGFPPCAVGDCTGDLLPDVIVGGAPSQFIENAGGGGLSFPDNLGLGAAHVVELADLDGDGQLDMVRSDTADGTVRVHAGDGDGTFGPGTAVHATPPNPIRTLDVVDATGDGLLDIVTASGEALAGQMRVDVVPGLGDGSFLPAIPVQGPVGTAFPVAVEVGDLDGDGQPDLVLLMNTLFRSTVRVFLGQGGGAFTTLSTTYLGSEKAGALRLADPDGDGALDLLVGGELGVLTLPGGGDGTFGSPLVWSDRTLNDRIVLADLDADGIDDLAFSALATWELVVLRGAADGSFTEAYTMTGLSTMRDMVATDFNHDGRIDLGFVSFVGVDTTFCVLRSHATLPGDPWLDVGFPLASDEGLSVPAKPILVAEGSLLAFENASLTLARNRTPQGDAFFVIGFSTLFLPFEGGVFVPSVDQLLGPVVNLPPAAALQFVVVWPPGIPPGTQFWVQAWFVPEGELTTYAATSAIRATVP